MSYEKEICAELDDKGFVTMYANGNPQPYKHPRVQLVEGFYECGDRVISVNRISKIAIGNNLSMAVWVFHEVTHPIRDPGLIKRKGIYERWKPAKYYATKLYSIDQERSYIDEELKNTLTTHVVQSYDEDVEILEEHYKNFTAVSSTN